jgi:hypothetical protein
MMIDAHVHNDFSMWNRAGGLETLLSFDPYESLKQESVVPKEIISWMQNLPTYIKVGELLISHTGHALKSDNWYDTLWDSSLKFPDDGLFRVIGHNIVKTPTITDNYALIDTGAYKNKVLTAFEFPSKKIWQAS